MTHNRDMELPPAPRLAALPGLLSRAIVVTAVFWLAAELGLRVATMANAVTLVWAPSGIALVAVLLWGRWMALAVVAASLIVSVQHGTGLGFGVFAAAANSLEALAGAFLLRRMAGGSVSLQTPREMFGLVVLAAGFSAMLSAILGTAGLLACEMIPRSAAAAAWSQWWLGDAMGVLLVAPPLLSWNTRPRFSFRSYRMLEAGTLAVGLGLATFWIFGREFEAGVYPPVFSMAPFLLWGAYRFQVTGAAAVNLLIAGVAVAFTLQGRGPFAGASAELSMRALWALIAMGGTTSLVLGALVAARDRVEAELRSNRAALWRSERLASLGTFAGGLAHEINNPLGTIRLAAEAARDAPGDPDLVSKAVKGIIDDTNRASSIVQRVLQFARRERSERSSQDLNEWVRQAFDQNRAYLRTCGVEGVLELAVGELRVCCDPIEIGQVVTNLIRNAAEACDGKGRVLVCTRAGADRAILCVIDNGHGMDSEQVSHAFDPFYTTRLNEGGTGLGASISLGIVESHGGTIEMESGRERGTIATVELPREGTGGDGVA